MIEKYSRYKLLREFFDFPRKDFHIRELSRRINLSQPTLINHIKELVKEGLISKQKKGIYPTFIANRDSELFKTLKKNDIIFRIKQTGLLDFLYDSCLPNSIILFGSASNGEDIEESDVDIFLECPEKKLDIKKYEKTLNRKINLFFSDNFSKLPAELKNNIINGTLLKGYLKVF